MKELFLLLSVLLFAGCCTHPNTDLELKIMSFNIRNGKANDGANSWEYRKELVTEVIRNYSPDVLGIQEAYRFQMDYLGKSFPKYSEAGSGRDGGSKGEYSALLFNKEKFQLLDTGTFWLSGSPGKPSASWGNRYRRICSWIHLRDKAFHKSFYVFNTHFDHQSQNSREKSVALIVDRMKSRIHKAPIILTGDFNAGEENQLV